MIRKRERATREAEGQGLQEAAVIRKRERAGSYTACIIIIIVQLFNAHIMYNV